MKAQHIKYFGFFWLIVLPVLAVAGIMGYVLTTETKERDKKPVLRVYPPNEQIARDDVSDYSRSLTACGRCGFSEMSCACAK